MNVIKLIVYELISEEDPMRCTYQLQALNNATGPDPCTGQGTVNVLISIRRLENRTRRGY